jgi:hypothetical protein
MFAIHKIDGELNEEKKRTKSNVKRGVQMRGDR